MAGLTKEQKAAKALLAKVLELSGLTEEQLAALSDDERNSWDIKAQEALDQEAAAAQAKPRSAKDDEPDLSGLIEVKQGVEVIHVHPTCLAEHKRLGWIEV